MDGSQLLRYMQYETIEGALPSTIHNVHTDSRRVQAGDVFVCIEGFTVDGHRFVSQAEAQGASLIVAQHEVDTTLPVIYVRDTKRALQQLAPLFFDVPSTALHMIGVTGTNGKTTVTHMIHQLLTAYSLKSAVVGTIGFQVGETLYETDNTTPNVLETQRLLRRAVDERVDVVSMEVSSHGLIEGRLAGVTFDTAIFTNLTHDHLDFHGTMEHYGYAKGLLFSQLGQRVTEDKLVILNADDPWSSRYAAMTPFPIVTYGFSEQADYRATIREMDTTHTTFDVTTSEWTKTITMPFVGQFNVLNAMAALLAVAHKGMAIDQAIEAFSQLQPIKGRMEKVETTLPITMYVDYAHSPDAIEKAIEAIRPYKRDDQRLLFLIGTGGNRDRAKRPIMAERASQADYVVLTTDDPRFEGEETILTELAHGMTHDRYVAIGDREEAVRHIVREANEGDIIIFAGKGHEDFQVVGNEKLPHSDAAIALDEAEKKFNNR